MPNLPETRKTLQTDARPPAAPRQDRQLRLPEGRLLSYRVYGDSAGRPLYFFHGFPGSRLQAALVHDQAVATDIALVAFDRPGFGRSDPRRAPTVESIAGDVQTLADALGHRRFGLLGVSCGGPHALATASLLGDRACGVGLLSGIGPMDLPDLRRDQHPALRVLFGLARVHPWLASPMLALDRLVFRNAPERALKALASLLAPTDRALLTNRPDLASAFAASLADAYRQGIGGALQEAGRIAGFKARLLDRVRSPVHIFQAGQDRHVPPAMGRYMAARLPHATLHDCPDDGHLSIVTSAFGACASRILRNL